MKKINLTQFAELIFDNASEGLIVIDKSGKIIIVNPRLCEMFEYTEEELLGETIEILIPKAKKENHVNQRSSYFQNPKRRVMGQGQDLMGATKSGRLVPVEIGLNSLTYETETLAIGFVTDITERVEALTQLQNLNEELETRVLNRTRELEDSQKLYSAIARHFPNGTINVFDRDFNYLFAEGKELYKNGITSDSLVGTNYLDKISPVIKEEVSANLRLALGGTPTTFEIELDSTVYAINAVPFPDRDGMVNQILVVESNITNQKQTELQMQAALEQEKRLNELKSRFVSMASHEFRTPLSTVLSSASLIGKYPQGDQQEKRIKHIDKIKNSVTHLTTILNDFLSLEKMESGKLTANLAPLHLHPFFNDLVDDLTLTASEGQSIELECDENLITTTDEQVLKNICINLLSNALKYSNSGSTTKIKATPNGDKLTIEVIDQGIGIPEDDQQQMFERFFRAKNVTNIEGTGLGLNLVLKYAEMLNGDITFKSELNEGTTFILTLPHS